MLSMAAKLLKAAHKLHHDAIPAQYIYRCTCNHGLQRLTEIMCRPRVPRCSSLRPCLGEVPHILTPIRAYFKVLQCQDMCIIQFKHMMCKSCIKTFNFVTMILLHLTQREVTGMMMVSVMQHDAAAQQTCLQHVLLSQAKRLKLDLRIKLHTKNYMWP
jgi:hypothetical protein